MINNKNKSDLVDFIYSEFIQVNPNVKKNFINSIVAELITDDKFSRNEYATICRSKKNLSILPIEELFWFLQAIENADNKVGKLSDYFTDSEIRDYKNYVKEKYDIESLYDLQNASRLSENQWTCKISVEQIALMRKHNIIRADYNFQRQSKAIINKEGDEILRKIYSNQKRVNEIESLLVDNKYFFNTIRINLMDDGTCKPNYKEKDNLLNIPENGDCIIPDGNHRCKACEQAYFNHPELKEQFANQYFQIVFTFLPPKEVKRMISQEWNVEKVNRKHIDSMKDNMSNDIVDYIKRSDEIEHIFVENIVTTGLERTTGKGFVVYSHFSDAIQRNYNANAFALKKDAYKLGDWLISFFNEVSSIFVDDFSNVKDSMKRSWVTNLYTIYGFVYLSKTLQNNEDWEEILKNVVNEISWVKDTDDKDFKGARGDINLVEEIFKRAVMKYV